MGILFGKMENSTKVSGEMIRCMERVSLSGLTEEVMKESTLMIRNRAMENLHGQMVEAIRDSGKMGNKMEGEFIEIRIMSRN